MTFQESQANRALARLLAQGYAQALRDADPSAAEAAITGALRAGMDGPVICSRIIAPAMRWIGELWERDAISFTDEHLATATTHRLLAKLQPALFPPPDRRRDATALLVCANGEQHTLGLSMVGDVLRSKGWRVFEMGADASADMVAVALARRAPQLVGFSATMSWSVPSLTRALERVAEIRPQAQVILGGIGIPARMREPSRWAGEVEEVVDLVDLGPTVAA